MSQMQTTSAWTSTGVKEEGVATLVGIEDFIEVAMTEKQSAAEPAMRFSTSDLFKPLEKSRVDSLGVPFPVYH